MTEITIKINGATAESRVTGPLTSGMVGVPVKFEFGQTWTRSNITKVTAVFEADKIGRSEELTNHKSGVCNITVPPEMFLFPNVTLMIGVEGRDANDNLVVPTTWARVGTIVRGASETNSPTIDIPPTKYEILMSRFDEMSDMVGVGQTMSIAGSIADGEVFNNYSTNVAYDRGHAQNDYTHAGWRSQAEGYGTEAQNTSHAGGRISSATGKGSLSHGIESVNALSVNGTGVVTVSNIKIASREIPVNVSISNVLHKGDFIHLSKTGMIPTDCRRIDSISADGKTIIIDQPFIDVHYTTAVSGIDGADIPAGANVRLDIGCKSTGLGSVSLGEGTDASGEASFAVGCLTTSSGKYSMSGGYKSNATKESARACGTFCNSTGDCADTSGHTTSASGNYSTARNYLTTASSYCQNARGRRNIEDKNGKYIEIVGNSKDETPSNAYTLDWSGNAWFAGDIYIGGKGQDDPGAKKIDDHINALIDAKLGVIENGSY